MSVSFTDESPEAFAEGYLHERSPIGAVYIPEHRVELDDNPGIRYEKYPWMEKFELDGIRPGMTCCIWTPAEIKET